MMATVRHARSRSLHYNGHELLEGIPTRESRRNDAQCLPKSVHTTPRSRVLLALGARAAARARGRHGRGRRRRRRGRPTTRLRGLEGQRVATVVGNVLQRRHRLRQAGHRLVTQQVVRDFALILSARRGEAVVSAGTSLQHAKVRPLSSWDAAYLGACGRVEGAPERIAVSCRSASVPQAHTASLRVAGVDEGHDGGAYTQDLCRGSGQHSRDALVAATGH